MDIKALLRDHPGWLDHLESLGGIDVQFPRDPVAELLRLAVPHEDVNGVVSTLPERGTPQWWLVERCVHSLVAAMGLVERGPAFPDRLPPELGPYVFTHVFLGALPYTRGYHRERGVPEAVSWATFTDLGRTMAAHRRRHGGPGLHAPWWFALHARGLMYDLGRLQFERTRLGRTTAEGVSRAGLPVAPGDAAIAVHVPDSKGPMTPEACDAAFARARAFFARHFPEERPRVVTCHSWLLDDQLARYLPAGSNIVAFQRRFHLLHRFEGSDMLAFVLGADAYGPELPRRTRLERAIADHLAAGGTWYGRAGWLPL
ncbi:acyltransferase domain-containing protein [Nonomuraea sp. 3-1Str]|uniref:acyltransferase domain-containing protein n=1 Tax=Nonomuraea sp. 3-1Str TaxID=2929801 RepID=UPI00285B3AF6|nr:acyltransferase domain-containing protein [Nonomuraea sp. 3-1Str]MDR8413333.1 acyltransferase domain-containing protein [Nonomuraea sp. 3-1Str]